MDENKWQWKMEMQCQLKCVWGISTQTHFNFFAHRFWNSLESFDVSNVRSFKYSLNVESTSISLLLLFKDKCEVKSTWDHCDSQVIRSILGTFYDIDEIHLGRGCGRKRSNRLCVPPLKMKNRCCVPFSYVFTGYYYKVFLLVFSFIPHTAAWICSVLLFAARCIVRILIKR